MRKNILLSLGFVFLSISAYGSTETTRDIISKNENSSNEGAIYKAQDRGISEIFGGIGDFMEDMGDVVVEAGDDKKEGDNAVETAGKHIGILGKICKLFGDLCKKVD